MTTIQSRELLEDPEGFEEPEDYTLRHRLGLRPVHYSSNDSVKTSHPDQRPCPSWCWVGHHPEYGHEIDYRRPMVANHSYDVTAGIVASLYQGDYHLPTEKGSEGAIHTATLEPRLSQVGQEPPAIRIYLRRYLKGKQQFGERLRLTPADAKELVAYLSHLIELAENG